MTHVHVYLLFVNDSNQQQKCIRMVTIIFFYMAIVLAKANMLEIHNT